MWLGACRCRGGIAQLCTPLNLCSEAQWTRRRVRERFNTRDRSRSGDKMNEAAHNSGRGKWSGMPIRISLGLHSMSCSLQKGSCKPKEKKIQFPH